MWTKSTDNSKLGKFFFYVHPQVSASVLIILYIITVFIIVFYNKQYSLLSNSNGIRAHNHLVRKRTQPFSQAGLRDFIITQSDVYYTWKLIVKRSWDLRISIQYYQFGPKIYQNSAGLTI